MNKNLLLLLALLASATCQAAYNPVNPNGQATMANSQPVVIASNQTGLPVTGTFWQATQPVSGTFWQATQPVSGPLTDAQLRATAVPVSGAFYQATQPVSGAFYQATQPVSGPLTDTQLRASAVPISGTVTLGAGTAYAGKVRITDGTLDTTLLNSAPASDTGQVSVPVRIISSLASGAGGGGPADVGTSTAASESDATRQKVTSSLRLLDTAQTAGSQLVAAKGDQTSGLWVNVKNTPAVTLASTTVTGSVAVTGPLTDGQLRATAVPISGTVTANAGTGTMAVSAASLPLPAGAATDALLTGGTARTKLTDGTNNVGVTDGTAAANETLTDRLKVAAALRLLDTAQTSGSQLIAAKGDQTNGLWVNVKNTPAVTLASTTITGSVAVTGPLTDTQLRASAVPVSLSSTTITGTVAATQSGTWNIGTVTTLPATPTGTNTIGSVKITDGTNVPAVKAGVIAVAGDNPLVVTIHPSSAPTATQPVSFTQQALPANQSVNVSQINAVTPLMGNGVTGTGSQRVTIASDNTAFSVNATPPALTKGTQGANGNTTQDLKDAGRNAVNCYSLIPVLTSATDTLQSLTCTKAGATVTATTTPAVVTAGKILRITRMSASYIATATSGYAMVRLRFNTAAVVAITSPIAASLAVGAGTPATANSIGTVEAPIGEAWEFAAGTGIGISAQGFSAVTATAVGYVLVSATGYEY